MLQWFSNVFLAFSQVFQMLVLSVSFMYVATVASGYFKSRSGVAHGMRWEAAGSADDIRSDLGDI
jgi:hypothetical protein